MSVLALPSEVMSRPGMAEKVMRYADVAPQPFVGPNRTELASLLN
jgi:hypothetical protein